MRLNQQHKLITISIWCCFFGNFSAAISAVLGHHFHLKQSCLLLTCMLPALKVQLCQKVAHVSQQWIRCRIWSARKLLLTLTFLSFHFYLHNILTQFALKTHTVSGAGRRSGRKKDRTTCLVVTRNAFSSICASLCLLKVLNNLKFTYCIGLVLTLIFRHILVIRLKN